MRKFVLLFCVLALVFGCASKRYVKKGLELENSGLYADAANQYYNSLLKNINNIDAKIALQRTGQLVLDDYIEKFKSQYQNGTPKEAVYSFREADNYNNKLKGVGMNLIFPEDQRTYYKEVEDTYLSSLYMEAVKALDLEEFVASEQVFSEILSLNNNYKDAQSKWVVAKYEPIYRAGKEQMDNKMFRSSYFTFKQIIDHVKAYENSIELMNQSLNEAKVTIFVDHIKVPYSSYQTLASNLKSKIVNGITGMNNPLYEVSTTKTKENNPFVEANSGAIAKEYDRNKDLVQEYIAAKAVLSGKVQDYKIYNGKLVKNEKRGYLKRTVEYKDKETGLTKKKTVYDKVTYYEYEMSRYVQIALEYSMKRTDRDELAVNNVFNQQEKDQLHYAVYEGDYKKLVPGYWKYLSKDSSEDYINTNSSAVSDLQSLLKSKRTAKSSSVLEKELVSKCVKTIVSEIANYKPEN